MADRDRMSGQPSRSGMQDDSQDGMQSGMEHGTSGQQGEVGRESVSDRAGTGGYGASSGFSGATHSGSDQMSGGNRSHGMSGSGGSRQMSGGSSTSSDGTQDGMQDGMSDGMQQDRHGSGMHGSSSDQALPQHEELQNRPDAGMRGRSTRRSDDSGMR